MCYLPDCDVSGDGGQQVAGHTGGGADGGGLGAGSVSDSYNRDVTLPCPGYLSLAGIAYAIPDAFYLQIVVALGILPFR